MDELTLLRELVADEPAEDEQARFEVWRRLSTGRADRPRTSRPRIGVAAGFAVCVVAVAVMFAVRSGPIGVEPAEAACGGSGAPSSECVRALAGFNASQASVAGSSKDRRRIVFAKYVNLEESDLYSMNPDGTDLRQLTRGHARNSNPAWSHNGTKIAFYRSFHRYRDCRRCQLPAGIYVMNADGTGQRLIARGLPGVTWSPDGKKIAFWRWKSGVHSLYVANTDGSDVRRVKGEAQQGSWSPGGSRIAFSRIASVDRYGVAHWRVYVMNADGTDERLLARNADTPVWSPDGRSIAYFNRDRWRKHTVPIWTMRPDGSGKQSLRVRAYDDCNLAWSPDSKKLVFTTYGGLFVIDRAGRNKIKLTDGNTCGVAWQPVVPQ